MPVRDLLMSAAGASSPPVYVDDVFSTWLYAGTGATQSINNGIDLTKGGLVWIKDRTNAYNNNLFNTVQGATKLLHSNTTNITVTDSNSLTSFNANGFTLGSGNTSGNQVNTSTDAFASWTFRKAPKFFDIVQYTGTGTAQAINHNLGSVPGCIIVKKLTGTTADWPVYHKGLNGGITPEQYYCFLDTTVGQAANSAYWNNTAPTSTQFTVGSGNIINQSGQTFIAYIFADQAGGFGATGTDSAIACGSYTGNSSLNSINLGWEAQYVMVKSVSATGYWCAQDIMRGMSQTDTLSLYPNVSSAETDWVSPYVTATANGFQLNTTNSAFNNSGVTYIYIAIRRPNKPPTTGTSVFSPVVATPSTPNTVTTNFPVDLNITKQIVVTATGVNFVFDRLRGTSQTNSVWLRTDGTSAETTDSANGMGFDNNNALLDNFMNAGQGDTTSTIYWNFKRAPTFFDEVCYTGISATTTINHNLTVAPEMMIIKDRSNANAWGVYHKGLNGGTTPQNYTIFLNTTGAQVASSSYWNNTAPTSSVFTIGSGTVVNTSGDNYVAYLFATCAGVSKVGSYTGNGTGQSIACGFGSGGARFILIKRTDSTGNWYVFDSANGLTSSSSPYLLWNSTASQVTGNNGVYASSGGFTLGATAATTTNIATATYIFLAIS